jgi:RHS repeat-associated protein
MNNAWHRIAGSWLILCLVALSGVPFVAAAGETLGYDLKGNIVSRQSASGTTNFQYDSLDRLTDEQGPQATQGFTYDPNGNRLTDGAGSYSYAPSSNVMATEHGNTVVHDAAGNMIDDGQGMTFEYNQAGRLKRVYDNSVLIATYTYNAMGQRTRKVTPAGTTVYHYDLDGQLIEETLADGSPQTTYVWRDSKPTAVIYAPTTPSNNTALEKTVYLHNDHLDTPRHATDDTRTTVWRWESDAFGSTAADADPDGDSNLTVVNLRFPGQYSDQETGLHYNHFRYYDPNTGRYKISDPVSLIGGVNTYGYVEGNPMHWGDPLGLIIIPVGTPAEVAAINKALAKIEKSHPELKARLDYLRQSSYEHTIRFPKPGEEPVNKTTKWEDSWISPYDDDFPYPDRNSGSETICDPTQSEQTGDVTVSGTSILVHELLGHGYDKDRGTLDRSINPRTRIRRSEEVAMGIANLYRKSNREPIRKKYYQTPH